MINTKSPYREGDVKWAFILSGSYTHYHSECVAQIKFTYYNDDTTHEVEILRSDTLGKGGHEFIPFIRRTDRFDQTKIFNSYKEAKECFIAYLDWKMKREIEKIKNNYNQRLEETNIWESFNKDLIRESKIDSICNEH